mgnify:CR=1 FL=1
MPKIKNALIDDGLMKEKISKLGLYVEMKFVAAG